MAKETWNPTLDGAVIALPSTLQYYSYSEPNRATRHCPTEGFGPTPKDTDYTGRNCERRARRRARHPPLARKQPFFTEMTPHPPWNAYLHLSKRELARTYPQANLHFGILQNDDANHPLHRCRAATPCCSLWPS